MSTLLSGIIFSIGADQDTALSGYQVIDAAAPYVSWTLPDGYSQYKFNIKISNAEPGGFAATSSGQQNSSNTFFQFTTDDEMNNNFAGLCRIDLVLSQDGSSTFENYAAPFYFVYDRSVQRLFRADSVGFTWQVALDPDNQPQNTLPLFRLQVCTSPLFDIALSLDGESLPDNNGSIVNFQPTSLQFDPVPDTPYFYRIQQFDGLDWGAWSTVNGFLSISDRPPELTITEIVPTGNEYGDLIIYFQANDPDSPFLNIDLSYIGGNANGVETPLSLLGPAIHVVPGLHAVTWRTIKQLGANKYTDIIIYGTAFDGYARSTLVYYGPITVDNTYIQSTTGGIGSTIYTYPVTGYVSTITTTQINYKDDEPVQGYALAPTQLVSSINAPVAIRPYAWANMYALCPLEDRPGHGAVDGGFGIPSPAPYNGYTVGPIALSAPIGQVNWLGVETWADWYGSRTDAGFITYITVTPQAFVFTTPYDVSSTDTLPKPISTRDFAISTFIKGYTDNDGIAQEYPDQYDWDNRPTWHIGREIWGVNDAWIQVAHPVMSEKKPCQICQGRNWIASTEGPPYVRVKCSNPNCLNGMDITMPNEWLWQNTDSSNNITTHGPPIVKVFFKIQWFKLSTWLNGKPFTNNERYGLTARSQLYNTGLVQQIWGRAPSSLEVVATSIDSGTGLPVNTYLIHQPFGVDRRIIDNGWIWAAEVSTELVRDNDGGIDVSGYLAGIQSIVGADVSFTAPIQGNIQNNVPYGPVEAPVQGVIGPDATQFYLGGVPPDSSPLASTRAFYPTNAYGPRITGTIGRVWTTQALQFMFLQPYWDDFNTIHWNMTGSDTSQIQIQYSEVNNDGTFTIWSDVQGLNTSFNSNIKGWLVNPFVFYTYWNTSDQSIFVNGKDYMLRIRQYDDLGNVFTPWVFSTRFTILHSIPNPASVLSSKYEPFSKIVTITLRLDSTTLFNYNLITYWYSLDNGKTWTEISNGDVNGEQSYLSSDPENGMQIHQIMWDTSGYSVPPTNDVRIKIECTPSNLLDTATLPFLKWLTPNNPYLDAAIQNLDSLMGSVDRYSYDTTVNMWKVLDPPVLNRGLLAMYQNQMNRIYNDPSRIPGPSGVYAYMNPSGVITDPVGYSGWLQSTYTPGQTHGQALQVTATTIDQIQRIQIPAAQQDLSSYENQIRQGLISQGYYAEEHFKASASGIREVVDAIPVASLAAYPLPATLERWWRFRVQKYAEGGDDLISPQGYFAPLFITELEQVYYKVQMDWTNTFDSQPLTNPLREFLYNEQGNRLSVAAFSGGSNAGVPSNPTISTAQSSGPGAGQNGTPNPNIATDSDPSTVIVGGVLKIQPQDLPGQRESDQMAVGQTAWDGPYKWRVAAYNSFSGPIKAAPRPLVTSVELNPSINSVMVDYTMMAHSSITSASIRTSTQQLFYGQIDGYQFSKQAAEATSWQDMVQLNFVSDRRAPYTEPSRNTVSWTPPGIDRPHPYCFYDDSLQQYVLFFTKNGFAQQLVSGTLQTVRYRPIHARMMNYPDVCEFAEYFENNNANILTKPCVIQNGSTYWMFMTSITSVGQQGNIAISSSTDLNNWTSPIVQTGATVGINPSATFKNGVFNIWYEGMVSGKVKVLYATSVDGYNWTSQNGGNSVYEDLGNVTSPNVVYMNSMWVMYYNDGETIASVYSSDGISWTGKKLEINTQTITADGAPHTGIPCNPCVFQDTYLGNPEWFMAFNFMLEDNTSRIFIARLEDAVWIDGQPSKIYGSQNTLVDVPSTRIGTSQQVTIDMSANGIQPTDSLKVRLIFDTFSPATTEFYRQSAWVDQNNVDEIDGAGLIPDPYVYNSIISSYPYMRFSSSAD